MDAGVAVVALRKEEGAEDTDEVLFARRSEPFIQISKSRSSQERHGHYQFCTQCSYSHLDWLSKEERF